MTQPGHVLIVDDTQKNIQVLGTILKNEGYMISVAMNGEQALAAVDRVRPDLVLLDVIMPVLDGFETCRRLKANPDTADIPVIFLTAKVESTDIVQGLELGAIDYVTKPFNATELLKRVRTHVMITRLQQEREERIRTLSAALDEIQRLQREQDAFLRHEVNNAVGPISGYAELLAEQAGDVLSDRQKSWLSKIQDGTGSIQRMLDGMKKLQTFEREHVELSSRPLDLNEMLDHAVRDLKMASDDDTPIVLDVPEQPVTVHGDPSFLPGVFMNLVKNATEHVRDLDSQAGRTVHVTLESGDGQAIVTVTNGGEPVPAERLATFFEKFNSTKAETGGTGLGTSYAALVTKAHGGRISVLSDATHGTRVRVELPAA